MILWVSSSRYAERAALHGGQLRIKAKDTECPYDVDRVYPVQTMVDDRHNEQLAADERIRHRETIGHAKVTMIRDEYLHQVTDRHARAEGFESAKTLLNAWRDRHGEGPGLPGTAVYPIRILTWVLVFEPAESPRFLAVGTSRPADEHGYSHTQKGGLSDELEAVNKEWLDRFSAAARDDKEKERQEAQRKAVQNVASVALTAEELGVDIDKQLRQIKRASDVIERKKAEAEKRLGRAA